MTESIKATRASVRIGALEVDGFMLPDGSYRMSQTQAADCVGKPEINARRFLSSRAIKTLLGEGYTPDSLEIEKDEQLRSSVFSRVLSLSSIFIYSLADRVHRLVISESTL